MKITKENIKQIIEEEIDELEAEDGLKRLEKKMGRRAFLQKFGLGAAAIIAAGGVTKFFTSALGKMTGKKAKEISDPKGPAGGGKPARMMPGLVPGDTIDGSYPIWDVSPFSVGGRQAVFMPIDQLPDSYMLPAERVPVKVYRKEMWDKYAHQHPEALRKMLESPGVWAYADFGFDQYPGGYWDEVTQGQVPQPELLPDPETGLGVPMLPPNWSIILELYQLKSLSHIASIEDITDEQKVEYMKMSGIYDEPLFDDMYKRAKQLKADGVFRDEIEVAGIREPIQERKIRVKIA